MNKKILQIIKKALIITLAITFIFSLLISQNECHLLTCSNHHCIYCVVIHISQKIINLSIIAIIAIVFGVFLYSFLSKLRQNKLIFILNSLIFRKVQLNE